MTSKNTHESWKVLTIIVAICALIAYVIFAQPNQNSDERGALQTN